jgi:hypothetical protein
MVSTETKAVSSTTLFMFLGQVFGTGVVVPIYYLLEYMFGDSPAEVLSTSRSNRARLQRSIYPTTTPPFVFLLLLFHFSVVGGAFFAPAPELRHIFVWLWFLAPLWVGLGNKLAALATESPPAWPPTRRGADLAEKRMNIMLSLSGAPWIHMLVCAPYSFRAIFVPSARLAHGDPLLLHSRLIWQADFWCTFASAALFFAYELIGMYRAGLLSSGDWWFAICLPPFTIAAGPGTAVAYYWMWKQDVMFRNATEAPFPLEWLSSVLLPEITP